MFSGQLRSSSIRKLRIIQNCNLKLFLPYSIIVRQMSGKSARFPLNSKSLGDITTSSYSLKGFDSLTVRGNGLLAKTIATNGPRSFSTSNISGEVKPNLTKYSVAQQYAKNGPTSNPPGPLFAHQPSTPKLPVPTLQETAEKYLRSLVPILSPEELEKTKAAVSEFVKPNGVGEKLQNKLLEKAKSTKTSWLIDWWNEVGYFGYRDPVVIYVSYFIQFMDDKRPNFSSQTGRAAALVRASMNFRDLVISEQLEPEDGKKAPLCSMFYRFLYNTCRIPLMPSDTTVCYEPKGNEHLAVVRKNQFYVFRLVNEKTGKLLSANEIEHQLSRIIRSAGSEADRYPVGALTSENRDVWTKAREELIKANKVNQVNLEKIESSVFLLCLDDTKPVTKEEVGRACWHGDGKNRFFDKSFQFIVFENGKAGFNGEHSMMDATVPSRMCEYVLSGLAKNEIDLGQSSDFENLPAPEKLNFVLNDRVKEYINEAKIHFQQHVDSHEISVLSFDNYGKDFIKSVKLSPDAYVQMAIQLAYYKMYGVCRPTYESSQTRKFAYGRTETTRSVSVDSVAFVKEMESPKSTASEKVESLRKAVASHSAYMADAVEGKGVDRHLLGLRLIAGENNIPKPAVFTDPAYSRSCHWNLSTSQISSEFYDNWGWGEVVQDGYGIPYSIREKSLNFWVSSQHLHSDRLAHYIRESLLDMRKAFEAHNSAIPKAKL